MTTLWLFNSLLLKMAIEFVDLPIQNGDLPVRLPKVNGHLYFTLKCWINGDDSPKHQVPWITAMIFPGFSVFCDHTSQISWDDSPTMPSHNLHHLNRLRGLHFHRPEAGESTTTSLVKWLGNPGNPHTKLYKMYGNVWNQLLTVYQL